MPSRAATKWADYGLTPLADLAPPYVALGGPHVALHVLTCGSDPAGVVRLSPRWRSTTHIVSREESLSVQVADVVVLRRRMSVATDALWNWLPPSRVLRIDDSAGDQRRLTMLTDRRLAPRAVSDLAKSEPEILRSFATLGSQPFDDTFKRQVRGLWDLDVWCPICGSEGQLVLLGMPDPSVLEARGSDGTLQPWPAGSYELYGCVTVAGEVPPNYKCPRCREEW